MIFSNTDMNNGFYDVEVLEGTVVRKNMPRRKDVSMCKNPVEGKWENGFGSFETAIDFNDNILSKGLLFLGAAGQGKTNVMIKLSDCILMNLKPQDVVIFLDVKGDYYRTFYQKGDLVFSPTGGNCFLNLFEDIKNLPYGKELEHRVNEIVEYLYAGQSGVKEPFWTNAAQIVTKCFILYLLYQAAINDDDKDLNHAGLCKIIDGACGNIDDLTGCYEDYRNILNSNQQFRTAGMFLPPADGGMAMGFGVITEIIVMRNRMFTGSFGGKVSKQDEYYISPFMFSEKHSSSVVFMEYSPQYQQSSSYVFRYFIDMFITARMGSGYNGHGKTYLILDELALLPNLKRLDQAINLGRSLGICVIAGLQEMAQLKNNYYERPHQADVILNAFQSIVSFNCDDNSIEFVQKRLGNAKVQKRYQRAGGGIALGEPENIKAAEIYEFKSLKTGESIILLESEKPFRFQFVQYE